MKLRLKPLLLTLVVSVVVLFGGWFFYQNMAVQSPLEQVVKEVSTVQKAKANITGDEVRVELQVKPEASLREIAQHIYAEGGKTIGSKKLSLIVTNASSPALDAWWSKALFSVSEAMETKHYTQIPETLQQLSKDMNTTHFKVNTEMDNHNVYVSLTDGKASKYIVLPRDGSKVGVWPNA